MGWLAFGYVAWMTWMVYDTVKSEWDFWIGRIERVHQRVDHLYDRVYEIESRLFMHGPSDPDKPDRYDKYDRMGLDREDFE